MLIFESDLVGFRCLSTGSAQRNFFEIHPSLVGRDVFDIVGCAHLPVEIELFPEPFIRIAEWPVFPNSGQRLVRANSISMHQVGACTSCRPGLAHGTTSEEVGASLESGFVAWKKLWYVQWKFEKSNTCHMEADMVQSSKEQPANGLTSAREQRLPRQVHPE